MSFFSDKPILSYLGLESDYTPLPSKDPVQFLLSHIHQLPPHLLNHFSALTTPKQRTVIPTIRNRRLKYVQSNPKELSFASARSTWPTLWQGRERRGVEEGQDEMDWVENVFLEGFSKHVNKLGRLLAGYEEEREAERIRNIRRALAESSFVPEEDSDSDEDETEDSSPTGEPQESEAELKSAFERLIRERFIYGLLDDIDYDRIDWNEDFDSQNDFDAQERWFDDEDEE